MLLLVRVDLVTFGVVVLDDVAGVVTMFSGCSIVVLSFVVCCVSGVMDVVTSGVGRIWILFLRMCFPDSVSTMYDLGVSACLMT